MQEKVNELKEHTTLWNSTIDNSKKELIDKENKINFRLNSLQKQLDNLFLLKQQEGLNDKTIETVDTGTQPDAEMKKEWGEKMKDLSRTMNLSEREVVEEETEQEKEEDEEKEAEEEEVEEDEVVKEEAEEEEVEEDEEKEAEEEEVEDDEVVEELKNKQNKLNEVKLEVELDEEEDISKEVKKFNEKNEENG